MYKIPANKQRGRTWQAALLWSQDMLTCFPLTRAPANQAPGGNVVYSILGSVSCRPPVSIVGTKRWLSQRFRGLEELAA
jgi:hypothetical protein